MKKTNNTRNNTLKVEKLVMSALMTALVIIFQCMATYTTFFGPFSTAIALIPIVIGAVLCGPIIGGWLGLIFGIVVMLTGGANLFFSFHQFGTIITVLTKGVACGLVAGLVYMFLAKFNKIVALVTASLICPIVNTGVFLLGCITFFMPYANEIASVISSTATGIHLFTAMALGNFLFEIGMNAILCPVMIKIIEIAEKTFRSKAHR